MVDAGDLKSSALRGAQVRILSRASAWLTRKRPRYASCADASPDAVNLYTGVWREMNGAALGEGNLDVEAFVESAEQGEHEVFLINSMRDQLPEFAGALAAAEEHVNEAMRRDIGTWEDERQANDPDVADRRAEA